MKNSLPGVRGIFGSFLLILSTLFVSNSVSAQTTREVNHQSQSWFSVNTVGQLSNRWSLLADVHIRRTNFLAKSNFEFLRTGVQYGFDKNFSVALGYVHMWLHPSNPGWKTICNETWIYQQALLVSKYRNVGIVHRLRNEQRWQQKISGDKYTGQHRFSDRVCYLLSLNIPVFKNPKLPTFNISDEILIQAGKEVVNNTFDQNRFFVGIRQKVTKNLSFDTGYMIVYQQRASGYQFDYNNTYRLFVYYNPVLKKHKM